MANPEHIFDRKNYYTKLAEEKLTRSVPSAKRRQNILLSQNADGLSDSDLRSHVRELRTRKIFWLLTFAAVPISVYFLRFNSRVVGLSLVPGFFFAHKVYNSNFLNTTTNFSQTFADNSRRRHLNLVLHANGKSLVGSEDMWSAFGQNRQGKTLPAKEWVARNEYR